MLDVRQPGEPERMTITHLVALDGGHRSMPDDKAVPFPRNRLQTKQVAEQATVGASVGNQRKMLIRPFDPPQRQVTGKTLDPALGEEQSRCLPDSGDKVPHRLAALETFPTEVRRPRSFLLKGEFCLVARRTVPDRVSDLLQPVAHVFFAAECFEQGRRRLSGTCER